MDYHQLTSGKQIQCPPLKLKDSRPLKLRMSGVVIVPRSNVS